MSSAINPFVYKVSLRPMICNRCRNLRDYEHWHLNAIEVKIRDDIWRLMYSKKVSMSSLLACALYREI